MSNKTIVSFSNHGRENYNSAMLGMIKSTKNVGWDGEYYLRSSDGYVDEYLGAKILLGEYPITEKYGKCWPHASVPYQFKPFLIQEAKEKTNCDIFIWMDSTVRLVSDPQPLIDLAANQGIVSFNNEGHPLLPWISDLALDRLKISEEELKDIKQIMACAFVIDFRHPTAVKVFEEWCELSMNGVSFQNYKSERAGFISSRHDQATLSGLLWKRNVPLLPYGGLCYPPHDSTKEYGTEIYFVNRGVN